MRLGRRWRGHWGELEGGNDGYDQNNSTDI